MTAARLAAFYAIHFGIVGMILPFWPLWLQAQGLDAVQIGLLLFAGTAVKIVANPAVAHAADRSGHRKWLMVVMAAGAAATFSAFPAVSGFLALLSLWVVYQSLYATLNPVAEALTIATARLRDLEYGPIRLWGSVAFIVVSVGGGWLVAGQGTDAIHTTIQAMILVAVVVCLALPDTRDPPRTSGRLPLGEVLTNRPFLLVMAAAGLIQGSHAVYYAFGTIHWTAAGHAETVVGLLWAEGVMAETLLFLAGSTVRRRFSPGMLLAIAGAAALLRWSLLSATTALPALVVVQALHGLTFGAAHLGMINYVAQTLPSNLATTAMSLYSAISLGVFTGVSMMLSGWLYNGFGGGAFLAMAAMGAAGGGIGLLVARRSAA